MEQVAVVSCDIVGHATADHAVQRDRVESINRIVRTALSDPDAGAVWASGGDGGHVLFRGPDWWRAAVALVCGLHGWARSAGVPLRIVAHSGGMSTIEGADGRTDVVGDALNVAGSLLEMAGPDGVIATEAFTSRRPAGDEVSFHDPRWLEPPSAAGLTVFLMSVPPDLESAWSTRLRSEATRLARAIGRHDAWETLYAAKRLMQLDGHDHEAERAVRRITADGLRAGAPGQPGGGRPNPLLSRLDGPSRVELVRGAELVERRRGEVICRHGDTGDTMFVLLRGRLGVFLPAADRATPVATLSTGDVVGELAFALQRRRTAHLVALTDLAMLGFTYGELEARLRESPLAAQALDDIERFMTFRVLANLSEHAPELIPAEDPEFASPDPDEARAEAVETALPATRLLRFPTHAELSTSALPAGGVSILASGRVRSRSVEGKQVGADPYRLLHVDLPDLLVTPEQAYVVDRPAVVVHIGAGLMPAMRSPLSTYLAGLRRSTRHCYHFDAFLSYAFADEDTVRRWQEALEADGLRVFRDEQRIGHAFPERLEAAIRDALTLVVFVSANTTVQPPPQNWVRREVVFREALFARGNAAVIPVLLRGGRIQEIAGGHSPVVATGDEGNAIAALARAIRRIRDGEDDPPYGRARAVGLRLGASA